MLSNKNLLLVACCLVGMEMGCFKQGNTNFVVKIRAQINRSSKIPVRPVLTYGISIETVVDSSLYRSSQSEQLTEKK
jgi:hypothetical protein